MRIETYFGRSCSHQDTTRELIQEALQEAGATEAEVTFAMVDSPEDARAKKVLGSPTIRVNGMDVEYGDREPDETTAGCRYYATPDGWKPVPHRGMIVRAITIAKQREAAKG